MNFDQTRRPITIVRIILTASALLLCFPSHGQGTNSGTGTNIEAAISSSAPVTPAVALPSVDSDLPTAPAAVLYKAATHARHSRSGAVRLRGQVPAAISRATKIRKAKAGDMPLTLTIVLNRTDQKGFDEF